MSRRRPSIRRPSIRRPDRGQPSPRRRAVLDAAATMLASAALGVVLSGTIGSPPILAAASAATGLALATVAAVSILRRRPVFCTPADRITLVRAVLTGGCTTMVVQSLFGTLPDRSWWLVVLAAPALVLDAVDGAVARRTQSVSAPGGRLDMETDAAFMLVLSVPLAFAVGPWVLGIGAMRYLFVAASWWRPALRRPLAFSRFRRVTAGIQGVVLVVCLVPIVPSAVTVPATAASLALLALSFGRDVIALERSGPGEPAAPATATTRDSSPARPAPATRRSAPGSAIHTRSGR